LRASTDAISCPLPPPQPVVHCPRAKLGSPRPAGGWEDARSAPRSSAVRASPSASAARCSFTVPRVSAAGTTASCRRYSARRAFRAASPSRERVSHSCASSCWPALSAPCSRARSSSGIWPASACRISRSRASVAAAV
jgi:hypothetical protein